MKQADKYSGVYQTLVAQLDKLARHNRQGSYQTRDRYYEAMKRFCAYLAREYRLQKLTNISGKHLVSYVLHLQDHGKAASTIKTDLSAIRFFHDKMSGPRYKLPANHELGVELERRRFGSADRTWSNTEFNKMLNKALDAHRYDYVLAMCLARYAGLRLHECFRIDTATAEQALRENSITVKGKGGKVRTVPISPHTSLALQRQLERTPRGHKLLVPDGVPTHTAMAQLERFLYDHRDEVREYGYLTFHGLRHTFAAEKYKELTDRGMSTLDAHFAVSRLLGHERADVTNIYLASLSK